MKKIVKILILTTVLVLPFFAAAMEEGEVRHFYVQPDYDHQGRDELGARLIKKGEEIHFYVDNSFWSDLESKERELYEDKIEDLKKDFSEKIKPEMTKKFEKTPIHPITGSREVSVLIHPMQKTAGGYFNSGDQYSSYQSPRSNEMTLLYLGTDILKREDRGGFLAHEFMHLLTFKQKERLRNVREEIWLNEARAEFIPTFLGYDELKGSNLDRRIETFLQSPNTSITEWVGRRSDYGAINIFTQYMVDHYGVDLLIDSLKSEKVGIESINYALEKGGFEERFSDLFNNFKVAVLVNDCDFGNKFCFKSDSLEGLNLKPATNHVPYFEEGSLKIKYKTKNWAGNWHKLTGGSGDLKVVFKSDEGVRVEVPYLLCKKEGSCQVDKLNFRGESDLEISNFDQNYESLTIMPSIQDKKSGFNGIEESVSLSIEASTIIKREEDVARQLDELRALLDRLIEKIEEKERKLCSIDRPLGIYSQDSESIRCLQLFLSSNPEIYPEGYVTGNFGNLTKKAVERFQKKYNEDILKPLELREPTGYVGPATIRKINELRGKK